MATPSELGVSTHLNLVDDFESAFQTCVTLLTSQEHFNVQDSEETKGGVESSVQKFLESARQMETFLLNKRLMLSISKPEHVLNEDVSELKAELDRKEKLIEKHREKLHKWQALLRSNAAPTGAPTPGSPYPGPQPGPPQGLSPASSLSGPSPGPPPPGQVMMAPGQYPGPPAGHPSQYSQPPPAYPQGPLAYLERM